MTNWVAVARARNLDIPDDALARIAPTLDALEKAFAPLTAKLPHSLEPAITLSEPAVFGE